MQITDKRVKEYAEDQGISLDEAKEQLDAQMFVELMKGTIADKGTKDFVLRAVRWLTNGELIKAQAVIIRVMQERAGLA